MTSHAPTCTDHGARPRRCRRTRAGLPRAALAVAVAVTAALAGCSSAPEQPAPAVFQTQPGFHPGSAAPTCLLHQTDQPTGAYQAGPDQQPEPELTFLAYYTGTADKPFCDGQPPTPLDRSWAQLYAQLTGDTTAVGRLLS